MMERVTLPTCRLTKVVLTFLKKEEILKLLKVSRASKYWLEPTTDLLNGLQLIDFLDLLVYCKLTYASLYLV